MKERPRLPDGLTIPEEICLYQELLECLEKEWHALLVSEEEAILSLAAQKEQILEKINEVTLSSTQQAGDQSAEKLLRLKRHAAAAQARNHRLIAAALETVQDFLGYLQSGPPGTYQAAGKVDTASGSSYFHRQA